MTYPRLLHPIGRNSFDVAEFTPNNPSTHNANSGKRRQGLPDLSRTGTTPSHRIKMAQIFQDAAVELATPSRRLSSNTRRFRDPLENTVHISPKIKESRANHRPTTPPDLQSDKLFPTPPTPPRKLYEKTVLPLSIGTDGYEEECHSSHGVPLVIPLGAPQTPKMINSSVDAWLDDVLALSPHPAFKEKPSASGDQSPCSPPAKLALYPEAAPSRKVSNKENIAPSTAAFSWSDVASPRKTEASSYPSPPPYPSSNSSSSRRFPNRHMAISDSHFQRVNKSRDLVRMPSKHKNNKASARPQTENKNPRIPTTLPTKLSYSDRGPRHQVCDDEDSGKVRELSPAVECFRKGRGPKRERCPSYYDQDIFPAFSPILRKGRKKNVEEEAGKGRRVLRDKEGSRELTKTKAFVEDAENAVFDFEVGGK